MSFDFGGFLRPVDSDGLNAIKGGSTVPLKWQIWDADGNQISSLDVVSSPRAVAVDCRSGEAAEEVETSATGGTELRYSGGQYIYNWTSSKNSGACYRVAIELTDGSRHTAEFAPR